MAFIASNCEKKKKKKAGKNKLGNNGRRETEGKKKALQAVASREDE